MSCTSLIGAADVLGAVIACSVLLFIRIPSVARTEEMVTGNFIAEMKEGYYAIVKHRLVLKLTTVMIVVAFLYIPIGTYFPLMVRNHFEKGVIEAGIVEVVFAIGLIVGASLLGVLGDRYDKIETMVAGMMLMGVALFISGLLLPSTFYVFVVMSF